MKHLTKTTDRGLQYLLLILASVASTACGTLNRVSPSVLEGTDEQLMSALAQLAREGSQGICDPRVVEKKLGVSISEPIVKTHEASGAAGPIVSESSEIRVANSRPNEVFLETEYRRFRSSSASHCGFSVAFKERSLCGIETGKFDRVMGVKFSYLGTAPHRWDFPIVYTYSLAKDASVSVFVGNAGVSCSKGFSVSAEGVWR